MTGRIVPGALALALAGCERGRASLPDARGRPRDAGPVPSADAGGDAGGGLRRDAAAPDAAVPDDPSAALFHPERLADIHIDFSEEALAKAAERLGARTTGWLDVLDAAWRPCPPYDNYLPATFTWEDPASGEREVFEDAGVRLRGAHLKWDEGDRHGFKVHLSALLPPGAPPRRLRGQERINVMSLELDDSVMVVCLAYGLMRDSGVPAPRCNHVRVFVNGEYYGLHEHVEEPDDAAYLERRFGRGATLYSVTGECDTPALGTLEYLGPRWRDGYHLAYGIEAGSERDGERQVVPLTRCADPDETGDAAFPDCVAGWIDVDEWLRLIAAEVALPSLEGLAGRARDYYLAFRPEPDAPHGGRFLVYDWDPDGAFLTECHDGPRCDLLSAQPWYETVARPPVLVDRLRGLLRGRFCDAVQELAGGVFAPAAVAARMNGLRAVVEEAMQDDPDVDYLDWLGRFFLLRDEVLPARHAAVLDQLATCRE